MLSTKTFRELICVLAIIRKTVAYDARSKVRSVVAVIFPRHTMFIEH